MTQHVVPDGDGWKVKGSGNVKATKKTNTQQQAFNKARKIAKNQGDDVAIHGKDGKIRSKHTYGKNDPHPPKG